MFDCVCPRLPTKHDREEGFSRVNKCEQTKKPPGIAAERL
jgi:hypothetical protein